MKPGGANAKGGGFERQVCRRLTWMITGKEQPEIFWRSATSGAKATQDRKRGVSSGMGGDIVAVDPRGAQFIRQHCVECKNRKSFGTLDNLMLGNGPLWDWWEGAVRDANVMGREPLLIFKANRTQTYVWLRFDTKSVRPKPLLMVSDITGMDVGWICPFEDWIKANRNLYRQRAK